ncbi:FAD-binding oxidoreductase [Streptococcus sp. 121]|uniref:NAD(P)/FAD-dependent oxidoreductase n=1 Tax=Streptococcus sp. 121 TaxID=2797637 RepID=UPI0018F07001|nr:FAD-dependent oxidoreductase [Streptococcus sp. 121]MBJ6746075.1 FAD-binding oxidoreductase [Streptococcus sp. 121]
MTRVAIIGAGIVGATAAFYLSQEEGVEVTVYDHGVGQASKAAAGIISPWFSRRRNKAWYRLARLGADFYPRLMQDLEQVGQPSQAYEQTGVLVLKKKEEYLDEVMERALAKKPESPLMGELEFWTRDQVQQRFPGLAGFDRAFWASGGARVDGGVLVQDLLQAAGLEPIRKEVKLSWDQGQILVEGQAYGKILLTTGAWLGKVLEPLGYQVDVRPQKGQILDYQLDEVTDTYPVVMPEGEADLIPFRDGKVSLGASHENDMGFDLEVDPQVLQELVDQMQAYYPRVTGLEATGVRVGIRAYTSDYSPFFGPLPDQDHVWTVSGLGSTGLTIGPLLGRELALGILGKTGDLDPADYPVSRYVNR